MISLAVVSDIHYASAAEQARGNDFEVQGLSNPLLRLVVRSYRYFIWQRHPLNQNHLLDAFLRQAQGSDYVVANGDYSCNSAFVGVSDDAACQSARECLEKLRQTFGTRFQAAYGDHELGKLSFFGGQGGMRLASWNRARNDLQLEPLWKVQLGNYVLIGVVSSLVALPVFASDASKEELGEWGILREQHLAEIRGAFTAVQSHQKVLLFCHDPTALPFLWKETAVRDKLGQLEQTIIGHLHSRLVFWKSQVLAGMPRITFLGHTAKRLSSALSQARHWKPFKVRLCPALGGIQLLNDGGFLLASLDPEARVPASFQFRGIPK